MTLVHPSRVTGKKRKFNEGKLLALDGANQGVMRTRGPGLSAAVLGDAAVLGSVAVASRYSSPGRVQAPRFLKDFVAVVVVLEKREQIQGSLYRHTHLSYLHSLIS